jgi:NADPH-dependent 2,4-dienoyl-CoA reductase/sulfur reductase-like enzyme
MSASVVILGAGYAGAHAARRALAEGARVTVVDPDGHHAFTPRFAAVAAGRAPIGDLAAPIDGLIDVEVVADLAVAVDPDERTVTLGSGAPCPTRRWSSRPARRPPRRRSTGSPSTATRSRASRTRWRSVSWCGGWPAPTPTTARSG